MIAPQQYGELPDTVYVSGSAEWIPGVLLYPLPIGEICVASVTISPAEARCDSTSPPVRCERRLRPYGFV